MGTVKIKITTVLLVVIFCLPASFVGALSINGSGGSSSYKFGRYAFANGDYARGFVVFRDGCTVPSGGSITMGIDGGRLNGFIIGGGGIPNIFLESDLTLGRTASFGGSQFALNGRGHSLVLTGSFTVLPAAGLDSLIIADDLIIDGQGNRMHFDAAASIGLSAGVTVTLRNLIITNESNASPTLPLINPADGTSQVCLDNVIFRLKNDMPIKEGRWYVHNDVIVSGTSKFSYASTGTMFVDSGACLSFDYTTTFSYSPGYSRRHALSERDMIAMADASSKLLFNDSTIYVPDSGLRLTKGMLLLDNRITIVNRSYSVAGNTDVNKSFEWGDGTEAGELDVAILAAARTEVDGMVFYNPSTS